MQGAPFTVALLVCGHSVWIARIGAGQKALREKVLLALRINHSSRFGHGRIKVADIAVLVEIAWVQLIPQTIRQGQLGTHMPLVLPVEVIVVRQAVVVLPHHVIERLVGKAKKEVGKVDAREHARAVAGIELVRAVVICAVKAQRSDSFKMLDIDAELQRVAALDPHQHVAVVVREGFVETGETVGIQAPNVIEIHLRNAVIEQVLQALPPLRRGPCFAVEAVVCARV